MKLRILIASTVWLVLVTALHVQLNLGWTRLGREIREALGETRSELVVGFLPVT